MEGEKFNILGTKGTQPHIFDIKAINRTNW